METPQARGPPSAADSDDISLISDEELDVTPPQSIDPRLTGAAAPRSWAEVDSSQLKSLAQRIAQRTLPDADKGSEILALTAASQDSQALPHDPLGLGVAPNQAGTAPAGFGKDAPVSWTDPRLQPSSSAYDPEIHAIAAYKDIPWNDLIRGLDRLRTEVREHTGQLKALVKENFDRFLSSKDTVDDIAARLKAAEAEGGAGVHGATPGEVASGMARTRHVANNMFGQLLERHSKGESLKMMLGMLGEYDSVVGLPTQIRQCAEARDFGGVLTLYKKAVKVVEERSKEGQGENLAVWEKLKSEVNKAMSSAVHVLLATIDSPSTPLPSAAEAAQHLGQLRDAGVPSASDVDPVKLFLNAQERILTLLIESAQKNSKEILIAVETEYGQQKRTTRRPLAIDHQQEHFGHRFWWEMHRETLFGASETPVSDIVQYSTAFEPLWEMTEAVTSWTLDIWAATVGKNSKEAECWASREADVKMTVREVLKRYSESVACIAQEQLNSKLLWEAAAGEGLARALVSVVVAGCVTLQEPLQQSKQRRQTQHLYNGLEFAVEEFRQLVGRTASTAASAAETQLTAAAQELALEAFSDRTDSFVVLSSSLPPVAASLRLLLCCAMRWLSSLHMECSRVTVDTGKDAELHTLLCSLALAFVDKVVDQAQLPPTPSYAMPAQVRDHQLLYAYSAVHSVSNIVLPQTARAWEGVSSTNAPSAMKKYTREVESRGDTVVKSYLDRKLSILDSIMEDFLSAVVPEDAATAGEALTEACALQAGWKVQLAPQRARPVVWTLLGALGNLRAELLAYAPGLCKDLMLEVLQGVVGGVNELVESGFLAGTAPENIYQLWLDVAVLKAVLVNLGDEAHRIEADMQDLCSAMEAAFGAGLERCVEESAGVYIPPRGAGGSGDGASAWTASLGDHRRWVQKVSDQEVGKAVLVVKAFQT